MKRILMISALCFAGLSMAMPEKVCMCTKQWDPVCGVDGKTYSNACEARCAKVDILKQGSCKE